MNIHNCFGGNLSEHDANGMNMKTATIQVLQGKNKFVVTEFDEDCIGNPAAANSMITFNEYSDREREENSRVSLYDTLEKASDHVREYYQQKEKDDTREKNSERT